MATVDTTANPMTKSAPSAARDASCVRRGRRRTILLCLVLLTHCPRVTRSGELAVDCDFPAGNVIVDRIDGDDVHLRQDLRDTKGNWFYWHFRVRGGAGRTLTFHFTNGDVIGVRGPALSVDDGETWAWLGRGAVDGPTFRYTFTEQTQDVRFCLAMPYTEMNLRAFLRRHAGNPQLRVQSLCRTRKGRTVERIHIGRLDGQPEHRVLLTCRHHACEMMAGYVLEGVMDAVLSDTDDGHWLRRHVEILAVPFMDKDGVEEGDQGKNRVPHDHNRDYAGKSIFPSVGALRAFVPTWSEGKLRAALDLHCPYVRGHRNEYIYFVGGPDQAIWERVRRFSATLERVQTGPLRHFAKDNLPFGQGWNTGKNYGSQKSFGRWAAEQPGVDVAATIEFPYANASGGEVTATTARAFGRDLARAIRVHLEADRAATP